MSRVTLPGPSTPVPGIPPNCICAFTLIDGRWHKIEIEPGWGCLADHTEVAVAPRREPLIGDRVCRNCDATLFEHCEVHGHWPPCCPGNCREPRGRGGRRGGGRPAKATR